MHVIFLSDNVDLICRHQYEYWNTISSDKFVDQTTIRIGRGAKRQDPHPLEDTRPYLTILPPIRLLQLA